MRGDIFQEKKVPTIKQEQERFEIIHKVLGFQGKRQLAVEFDMFITNSYFYHKNDHSGLNWCTN